ncbi:MAG TPA: glycosyltransferase family 2 protein [Candidatus Krumholzibacteriaceae bacterium]|nr:glycosyltransferase family 2 protein [Candidatus Krumholzibacteriaceae bacterium]
MSQQFIEDVIQHSEYEGLKPFILACIPAYNEEKTIGAILDQAFRHVEHVIVCDDGSTDGTNEVARRKGATVVRNPYNMGKGRALQTCFRLADRIAPDVIVMMDADGKHDPEDIPRLVAPILEGEADLVIGSRYVEGSSTDAPLYRRVGLSIVNAFNQTANDGVKDTQSGFRAFNKDALRLFTDMSEEGFGVESEQPFHGPEVRSPRDGGPGHHTLRGPGEHLQERPGVSRPRADNGRLQAPGAG